MTRSRWNEDDLRRHLALGEARIVGEASAQLFCGDQSEASFLGQVRRFALEHGWLFHHVRDSRGCDAGFLDVCCAKPGHPLMMVELKSQRGKVTHEQETWLAFLRQVTGVYTDVWRPSDWKTIRRLLES